MRGKEYDEHVKRVNALKEQLKKDPDNKAIREEIQKEEDNMFDFIITSSKELEVFIRSENEGKIEDDF